MTAYANSGGGHYTILIGCNKLLQRAADQLDKQKMGSLHISINDNYGKHSDKFQKMFRICFLKTQHKQISSNNTINLTADFLEEIQSLQEKHSITCHNCHRAELFKAR